MASTDTPSFGSGPDVMALTSQMLVAYGVCVVPVKTMRKKVPQLRNARPSPQTPPKNGNVEVVFFPFCFPYIESGGPALLCDEPPRERSDGGLCLPELGLQVRTGHAVRLQAPCNIPKKKKEKKAHGHDVNCMAGWRMRVRTCGDNDAVWLKKNN